MPRASSGIKLPNHRPRLPICWDRVNKLLIAGCSGPMIAGSLGMHEDTLYERTLQEHGVTFSYYAASYRQTGQAMIAEKQFQEALGLNGGRYSEKLLVMLGEERLGQGQASKNVSVSIANLADLATLASTGKLAASLTQPEVVDGEADSESSISSYE